MATHVKIQVPANSTGEQLDTVQGTVTGITGNADRQVMVLGDPAFGGSGDALVGVINTDPVGTEYGLIVRPIIRDATAAVSIAVNGAHSDLTVSGFTSFAVQLVGTWTGTIVFEANIDPTNVSGWVGVDVWDESQEKYVTSTTANGNWWFEPIGSVGAIRVRASAWTSGTATGLLLAGMAHNANFEYTGANGTTLPSNIAAIGGSDGTNLRALSVDTTGKLQTVTVPTTTGGLTTTRVISAASTNASTPKASAGQVYGWSIQNSGGSNRFVKLYNKASNPTVGTDTPFMTLMIPTGGGNNFMGDVGIPFSTGIAMAITANGTDADTTAVAATEIFVNLFFK
jgi:hypothetical protein